MCFNSRRDNRMNVHLIFTHDFREFLHRIKGCGNGNFSFHVFLGFSAGKQIYRSDAEKHHTNCCKKQFLH